MEPKHLERGPKRLTHTPPQVFVETLARQLFPEDKKAAQQFVADLLSGKVEDEEFFIKAKQAGRERESPVEVLKLFETKRFSVPEGAATEIVLTSRLNGCIATVVVGEGHQIRDVVMSHFPPLMVNRNINGLTETITPDMRRAPSKKVFILVAANRKGELPRLQNELIQLMGADTPITVQEYTTNPEKPDSGVLLVKIPPAGQGEVSVHTWEQTQNL